MSPFYSVCVTKYCHRVRTDRMWVIRVHRPGLSAPVFSGDVCVLCDDDVFGSDGPEVRELQCTLPCDLMEGKQWENRC